MLTLTIRGGYDKDGVRESIEEISISEGTIVGVVGPTGSGKSTLINDIEQLACGDTFSKRQILVNGEKPTLALRTDPHHKIIAQLSQNMHFLTDIPVHDFLKLHARSRKKPVELVDSVIDLANSLSGEEILPDTPLTILSGGQSRALMIADIAVISQSPVVLIDEIENAGIKKRESLNILIKKGKIVLIITHEPMVALMSEMRIVMANGGIKDVLRTTEKEKMVLEELIKFDDYSMGLREKIRQGVNL
jgi:ABC-type lipoprotein export system ATPase subunit